MNTKEQPYLTLLLLDLDGEAFGFSNGPSVSAARTRRDDGPEVAFVSGIKSLSLPSRTIGILESSITDGSSSIIVSLHECDGLRSLLLGASMSHSYGKVYLWVPGEALSESYMAFSGVIRSPSFDVDKGIFKFSLSIDKARSNPSFPSRKIGDTGRFSGTPENSHDEVMPIVYGRVKRMAVPTIRLNQDDATVDICVAAHEVVGSPESVGNVQIGNSDTGDGGSFYTIYTAVDGLGDRYSYVTIPVNAWRDSNYVVDMVGKPRSGVSGGISSLGNVLYDVMVATSGVPFDMLDHDRLSQSTGRLNELEIGIGINENDGTQTLYDILSGRIQGQYPVVFGSPTGLYGWDCTIFPSASEPPAARIIYGHNAFTRGVITQTSIDSIQNKFEMSFSVDGVAEGDTQSALLDKGNSELLYDSVQRYGESSLVMMKAPDCPSPSTASKILADAAAKKGMPRVRVSYSSLGRNLLSLPLMSVVLVTDEAVGWEDKKFVVESISPLVNQGLCDIRLLSFDPYPA